MSIPTRPHPNPPPPLPLSPPSSTSPRPKLLSRTLFSPPTPAEPTLVTASGHVVKPVASGPAQIYVARPPPPAEFIPRGRPTSIKSLRSSTEMAVSSAKPASPERYSDEEILMTLQMPPDPSGTPSGFIDFLDPCREVSPADDVRVVSNESPSFDFIMDFEEDLDTSFEMLVEQDLRLNLDKRVAAAGLLTSQAPSPPKRPPSMPTIFEEEEPEEEAGDVTITPSAAQRALLPPDRFARPRSASPLAQVVEASEDITDDSSDMDTPRPRGKLLLRFFERSVRPLTFANENFHSPSGYFLRTPSKPIRRLFLHRTQCWRLPSLPGRFSQPIWFLPLDDCRQICQHRLRRFIRCRLLRLE